MTRFEIGDYVRLVNTTKNGRLGRIKALVPNLTADEHFQAYLVELEGADSLSEYYLQYELRRPLLVNLGNASRDLHEHGHGN